MDAQTIHAAQANNQFWMWFIGIAIGVVIALFQGISILQQRTQNIYLKWTNEKFENIFNEIRELWDRANTHDHYVECDTGNCKPRTKGVIPRCIGAVLAVTALLVMIRPAPAADFAPVWEKTILPHEGGYTNNIHDSGNWTGCREGKGRMLGTKYGISACRYGTSLLKKGIIIKHLTKAQARELFYRDYWLKFHFEKLASQGIAEELCDEAVNLGSPEPLLEKVWKEIEWSRSKETPYSVPVPPRFTPETVAWINEYTRDREHRISMYNSIRQKRVKFYVDLVQKKPIYKQFFYSWIARSVD